MHIEDLLKDEYLFMDHEKQTLKHIFSMLEQEHKLIKDEEDEAKYMVRLIERMMRYLGELRKLIGDAKKGDKKAIGACTQMYAELVKHHQHFEQLLKEFDRHLHIHYNLDGSSRMSFEYQELSGFRYLHKAHEHLSDQLKEISRDMFGDYAIKEHTSIPRLEDDFLRHHQLDA